MSICKSGDLQLLLVSTAEAAGRAFVEVELRDSWRRLVALAVAMAGLLACLSALKLRARLQRRRAGACRRAPASSSAMQPPATSTTSNSQSAVHEGQNSKLQQQQQLGVIHLSAVAAAAPLLAAPEVPAPAPAPAPALAPATHHAVPPAGTSVSIISSLELSLQHVERLERELVAERHRFVCLLLASMAREQLAAVASATAAGEQAALAVAARVHFAVAEAGGQIVAGAVFYPRCTSLKQAGSTGGNGAAEDSGKSSGSGAPCAGGQQCGIGSGMQEVGSLQPILSLAAAAAPTARMGPGADDAAAAAAATVRPTGADGISSTSDAARAVDPHLYVELLVTSQPGRGWGSLLLQRIEQHARQHAGQGGPLAAEGGQALKAIKLLSVAAAQDFYSRHSYSQPDKHREMFKLLWG